MAKQPEDRKWAYTVTAGVAGFLAFAVLMGMVILPLAQAPNAGIDAWTAICRAMGLRPGTPAQPQPSFSAQAAPVSQVRWTPQTLKILASADPKPGAALASAVCSACHGENGFSPSGAYPHLAGQSSAAIFKQLSDYRSGARFNAQMTPVAKSLSEPQLAQVAVYFSVYGDPTALGFRYPNDDVAIIRLAHRGDPARGIPPCEACHARGSGGPPEAPVLTGQHSEYLNRQLHLYKDGGRRNDVYRRMREITSELSDDEMQRLALFYQGLR